MKNAALPLPLLAAFFFALLAGCSHVGPTSSAAPSAPTATYRPAAEPAHTYAPSPHVIVGYILDIDEARGFAVVDLTADPLPTALAPGTELSVRTRDLKTTARLTVTRFLRGHTLGATIATGLPAVGEEVVLLPH